MLAQPTGPDVQKASIKLVLNRRITAPQFNSAKRHLCGIAARCSGPPMLTSEYALALLLRRYGRLTKRY
jgi:hypothetical protein